MYHKASISDPSPLDISSACNWVAKSDDQAGLREILGSGCALAIWDRPPPPVVRDLAVAFDRESLDDINSTIPSARASLHAAVLLGAAGYDVATAVALAAEIEIMVGCLNAVLPAERLRLRLEVVETDACRRFHADMVTLRLLVTLRGPGTQWIRVTAPGALENVPTGAVALFKGRLLQDQPAILHRSPPIADTGQDRLVLVIDPA